MSEGPTGGYRVRPCDPVAAHELARAAGVDPAVAQVLIQRGFSDPAAVGAFLDPTLAGLTAPDAMVDREAAADRLARAARTGERVVVYGDYDVDGTTSAAILADILEALGADVRALLATRFDGGYGLSEAGLDRCLAHNPGLLVTCDCGSSDHARIARARAAGVDVVVVDHHLVPVEPLPACAFLNPHRPDCGFPYKGMASAGLAFSLGAAVRTLLGVRLDLRPWLDLVALGTVADMAPLDGDNRRLVRAGLAMLGRAEARPGVVALRDRAKIRSGVALSGADISFRLAPRLNAPGRLGDPAVSLALLRTRSMAEAVVLAATIEAQNDQRKLVEREVTEKAIAQALEIYGDAPEGGVVVAGEGWHPGVVGITAARLVERFGRPALVVALDGAEGTLSGRTPAGFDLHRAISASSEALVRFGGHAAAVGATVRTTDVERLRACFADATREFRPGAVEGPLVDVELGAEFAVPCLRDLQRIEPTGLGNATPRFAVRAAVMQSRTVGQGGEHLKLTLRVGPRWMSAFGIRMGGLREGLPEEVVAVGTLRPDTYRGPEALELHLEHLVSAPA